LSILEYKPLNNNFMDTIVVGIDFSKSSLTAMKLSIDVAARANADLHIVWVETVEMEYDKAEEKLKEYVSKAKEKLVDSDVYYHILPKGKVYLALNKAVKEFEADLLIIGTHGNSGYDEKFAGANTYKTITDSHCPVLTIREDFHTDKDLEVLIMPIDFTKDTRQKVPWTIEFAKMFPNSEIYVLGIYSSASKSIRNIVNKYVASVENLLKTKNMKHRIDFIEAENTTLSTIEYANKHNADLIVIMSEQEKTLSNIFLGPYAQQMINNSHIPVLTCSVRQLYNESR
jgi:nucleotide-binding universal stress UspA family protein